MLEFLHALWRQKSRFFLLLAGIAVGAASICAVGAISQIGSMLCEQELDAMGLSGLIVISADSSIQSDEISRVERQQEVARQTPLACEYAGTGNAQDSSKKKVLLWGIDERTYRTVKITLLHGRLLNDSDAKTDCGMVDKSFAKALYGRENIIGKHIAVRIGDMPVSIEVVGVVDTGGSLTGQLMGSTIPSFLYLPMQTLAMYSGKSGYSQVMITLDKNADPDSAAEHIRSCFSGSVQIQNMTNMRDQLSGILRIFRLVLNALGGVSFVTCGFSVLTVMLQNVGEARRKKSASKRRSAQPTPASEWNTWRSRFCCQDSAA